MPQAELVPLPLADQGLTIQQWRQRRREKEAAQQQPEAQLPAPTPAPTPAPAPAQKKRKVAAEAQPPGPTPAEAAQWLLNNEDRGRYLKQQVQNKTAESKAATAATASAGKRADAAA